MTTCSVRILEIHKDFKLIPQRVCQETVLFNHPGFARRQLAIAERNKRVVQKSPIDGYHRRIEKDICAVLSNSCVTNAAV